MYKCGKNVTCNFDEASFLEEHLYRAIIVRLSKRKS